MKRSLPSSLTAHFTLSTVKIDQYSGAFSGVDDEDDVVVVAAAACCSIDFLKGGNLVWCFFMLREIKR